MSIFDINLYRKAVELMPVDKRTVKNINYLWGLVYPLQQDQVRFLENYRTGTTGESAFAPGVYPLNYIVIYKQVVYIHLLDATVFPFYNSADTYTFGQGVIYNSVAYLCNVSSTTGAFAAAAWAPDSPPSANWQVYLPSFIGASQRVLFSGQYLTLTYALNDYYNVPPTAPCNFRQPGLYGYAANAQILPGGGALAYNKYSDIYITNLPYSIAGFRIGETTGSWVGETTASDGIGEDSYPFLQVNNFTINVPSHIYTKTTVPEIAQFVNKIIPAGLTFTVTPY